jgi:hypothetical protein
MTDEIVPTTPEEVVEHTPTELKAIESGWVPKEEFSGDEHKWVEAGEFLRRGELFKKIEDQGKQLKDVRSALNEMKKLNGQIQEVEYKRALDTLKAQKKVALEDGDAAAVIAADDRIEMVREQQKEMQRQSPVAQSDEGSEHPEFVAWTEQNNWYKSSTPMKAFADALGQELARAGNSPSEVLKKVAVEVRKEFPNKFRNPNQDKPGAVEGGQGRGVQSTGKFTLSDEERTIMNKFVRQNVMTEKEYIEQLKKVRG